MVIYFGVVFGLYFLLLLILCLGWRKVISAEIKSVSKNKFISIVIAMRNEEGNLQKLFQSLIAQTYPTADFEIIIVDDHSVDQSRALAQTWIAHFSSLTVLSLSENLDGKKAALAHAIGQARGEIIACTDADCVVPPHWLQRINEGFQDDTVNMLIGAVALSNERTYFSRLQSIEFGSVIGTGLAFAALENPILCNGANLSFRKKLFDEVNGYSGNEHIASGDDEFLMRKILRRHPDSIGVLNIHDSIVVTKPQGTSDFFQQRLRWASKWKSNSSQTARSLAVFMFTVQISWIALLVGLFVNVQTSTIAIGIIKVVLDFVFLLGVCRVLKMRFNFLAFAGLQFLHPLYVFYVGIFSQFKNHEWKGRWSQEARKK